MSKISKRRCTAGSGPDHAHKTVSESRCAQELEEHPFLYDLGLQPPQDDDAADLLAPVPAVRTGGLGGYARVSTKGQVLDRQIHALIVQGTNEGLDAARARGARLGRPSAMTGEQVRHARDLLARPENTVTSIAKLLGVSRNTIYNYVPELKGGRLALTEVPRGRGGARRPSAGRGRDRQDPGPGMRRPTAAGSDRPHPPRRRPAPAEPRPRDVLTVAKARKAKGESITAIAKALGVSRATLYRHIG
jgi:DNA invertase Pin-like site-specific DNA recombinase